MIAALGLVARYGRFGLVAGLLAGLFLPDLATTLRPFLPHMIAVLLALTALRIGPRAAFGSVADTRATLGTIALFQVIWPLVALVPILAFGVAGTPVALVILLMFAAPPITGAPNFAILLSQPPAPALRLLVLGTALFPVTVLPVFWALPALGDASAAFMASARLVAVIALAVVVGFAARSWLLPRPGDAALAAIDGVTVAMLAIIVVGLMAALGPALQSAPGTVAAWLALACALNWGGQIVTLWAAKGRAARGSLGIIGGNRNVALLLVALPADITDPLLIFIGCYQIPMYLTPIVMRPFYRFAASPSPHPP